MNVSVVIPLYNKAPYIERAVNSVLSQSFRDFEILEFAACFIPFGIFVLSGVLDWPLRKEIINKIKSFCPRKKHLFNSKSKLSFEVCEDVF